MKTTAKSDYNLEEDDLKLPWRLVVMIGVTSTTGNDFVVRNSAVETPVGRSAADKSLDLQSFN
jgi:hypothetical protein